MNKIDNKELFRHVSDFFKSRGVELHPGPYTKGIQKSCEILADTVNLSQAAMERAREQMEKHFEQMRQIIHERTAPKPPRNRTQSTARGKMSGGPKSKASRRKGRG